MSEAFTLEFTETEATERSRDIAGRDSVNLYLEEIASTPLLNAEQEVELSKTIEAGLLARKILDGVVENSLHASEEELTWLAEEGERAKSHFLNANLRLVVSIARKYGWSEMPFLDLIQEGNTGLIRAVEKFDYTKGYKFSTYATWWIRQAISRGIAQQARIVRLPVHVVEELNQVNAAQRKLELELGRDVEPDDIALELGMNVERVNDLIRWGKSHASLDAPIDEDGETTFGDLIEQHTMISPEDLAVTQDTLNTDHNFLNTALARLDNRTADVIRLRRGLADGRVHKLEDIGKRYGVSGERVRQIERFGIEALRCIAEGKETKAPPVKTPPARKLGKRALLRLEVAKQVETAGESLSEDDMDILRLFIATRSFAVAAEMMGITSDVFSKKYYEAKASLDAVTVG